MSIWPHRIRDRRSDMLASSWGSDGLATARIALIKPRSIRTRQSAEVSQSAALGRLPRLRQQADGRSQSDRLGDDHAVRAAERPPLFLAPAGLAQPRLGVILAIGLTLPRDD